MFHWAILSLKEIACYDVRSVRNIFHRMKKVSLPSHFKLACFILHEGLKFYAVKHMYN